MLESAVWSIHDEKELTSRYKLNRTVGQIAAELRKPIEGVYHKIWELQLHTQRRRE